MKLPRVDADKEYGGGSGKEIFNSEYFRVVNWQLQHGEKTVITYKSMPFMSVEIDGKHQLDNDELCIEQFNADEIFKIIHQSKLDGVELGRHEKMQEIKLCLGIKSKW